jgi:DNA-binding transcriptional regulator LsrR (DeoR family)
MPCPECSHCRRKKMVKMYASGIKQADIAKKMGITQTVVSRTIRSALRKPNKKEQVRAELRAWLKEKK